MVIENSACAARKPHATLSTHTQTKHKRTHGSDQHMYDIITSTLVDVVVVVVDASMLRYRARACYA